MMLGGHAAGDAGRLLAVHPAFEGKNAPPSCRALDGRQRCMF